MAANSKNNIAEIAAELRAAAKLVVISHYNPDPDAYGSACGLALGLKSLGKEVLIVNESGSLARYQFIPGVNLVQSALPPGQDWGTLVACDCGDRKRLGDSFVGRLSEYRQVINIDHHSSNDFFGHFNLVVPHASSTAEVIFDVLTSVGVKLSSEMATCLYAGLASDTGSFRYSSTTERTFAVARELVLAGAKPDAIAKQLYSNQSLAAVRLQAKAMSELQMLSQGRIGWVEVTRALLKSAGAELEDADVLVDLARDIEGVEIAVLLKEDAGLWRVSLRAKNTNYDVSAVAAKYGGGGHKAAAGFRWRKGFPELKASLVAALEEILRT